MSKLEPALQQAMAAWRVQSDAKSPDAARAEAEKARRVSVVVTYEGDLAALQAAGLDTGFDRKGVVSGLIAFQDLERLDAVPGVVRVTMQPKFTVDLDDTVGEMRVPWKVPPTTPWPGKGANVIVAIIDTGIDIFHESFKTAAGQTRIKELWDQGASTGGSNPDAAFQQIGRVYSEGDINAGIAAGPPFASVDTDGHGTHVAGTAAGNGRQDDKCASPGTFVGVAPEADLVVVKAIGLATSNVSDALHWCAQASLRLSGSKPVVINCSFSSATGPHDGAGATDGEVDEILRPASGIPQGLAIVCSAGNKGNSEIHETNTVAANATATQTFYVSDRSTGPGILEIWYAGAATLNVALTAPPNAAQPGTNTTGPIPPNASQVSRTIGGMTISIDSSVSAFAANGNRKQIIFSISVPSGLTVRSGVWTLTLTETAGVAANWDAWVASGGDRGYLTFRLPTDTGDAPARRRNNTIGEFGTSLNAITVANYSDDDGKIAASSSRGVDPIPPGTDVGEIKPTIAAPGTAVAAPLSRGVADRPSSCCNQQVVDLSGTSMSAPHVTGLVALMFEKNPTLTFVEVREHLQHSTRVDGIPAAEVPPPFDLVKNIRAGHIWGSGKVDAAAALQEVTAAAGGGGPGGGGGTISLEDREWGHTPHTIFSRLGDLRGRFGSRPGLMLAASLISEHVDEILRLINENARVGAVWRRQGGPLLVRHLLYGPPQQMTLLPAAVDGCDVASLIRRFVPIIDRFSGARLKADIVRYRQFVQTWPGADVKRLDAVALRLAGPR